MKKLLLTLFISLGIIGLTTANADNAPHGWFELGAGADRIHYLEMMTMKEKNGYLYVWEMADFYEPYEDEGGFFDGSMSYKAYSQVDCDMYRLKNLSYILYTQPLGEGLGEDYEPPNKWIYPPSNNKDYGLIDTACMAYDTLDFYK